MRKRERKARGKLGVRIADNHALIGVERAVGIQPDVIQFARAGIGTRPVPLRSLDNAVDHIAVERIDRIADSQHVEESIVIDAAAVLRIANAVGIDRSPRILGRADRNHLVAVEAEDSRRREIPVLGRDDAPRNGDLETLVPDLPVIDPYRIETGAGRQVLFAQQVGRFLNVIVERDIQASPEDREVEADIHLRGLLPRQFVVGHARIGHEAVAQPFAAILVTDAVNGVLLASRPVVIEPEALEGLVRGDPLVTRDPVTGAQLELVEESERLDPGLLLQLPAYRTRREKAPAVSLGEFRSAVGSCRESHQITVLERIVQAGEPRSEDLLAARRRSYDLIRAGNDLVLERRVGEPATGNGLEPRLTLFS